MRVTPLPLLAAASLTAFAHAAPAPAPLPPAAIAHELERLRVVGTVLHVAAHPDDENTEFITYASRGRGYRTAYLSLTRGDGGQNELGRDFDEKLGLLRTQELLAARALDGGRQFFTRAIDFGYSKTPEETLAFWDRDQVLADVVRIYRQYRPDVVVTRFPIPPGSGGHGHHTASGMLAVEAFKLAGDPAAYPEQLAEGLTPWQPRRVLWNAFRFGGNADAPLPLPGPVIKQDIAGNDPVTGEAFGTIAAHSRAMHKTQGLGGFVTRARTGANEQTFLLMAGDAPTADFMDGVDTTWARYAGGAAIDEAIARARAQFDPANPAASVPALLDLRRRVAALPADPVVEDKRAQLDRIIQSCLGLAVRTTVAQPEVVPGGELPLTFHAEIAAAASDVRYAGVRTSLTAVKFAGAPLSPSAARTETLTLALPADLPLSQPYWLREDHAAGIARVSDRALIGRPANPPAVAVTHLFEIAGETLEIADEPIFRGENGRLPRRLEVIPPVALTFASEVFYLAPGATKTIEIHVTAARAGVEGTLRLDTPAGWAVARNDQSFQLAQAGGELRLSFDVTAPATGGRGEFRAVARVGGRDYSHQRLELRYAHLPAQLLQPPARVPVASFALATRGRNIGYLPGAGDYVAECLLQMGYSVRPLTGAELTPENLAGLDAVVIGVRAFNERADLKAALPGLFAWVEQGGTVIAQYNRPNGLAATPLAPFELSIEGPAPRLRVTDENAPVTFLAPEHAALTSPNRLDATADFAGWVQERGAYFPSKWDESAFTAILAMNDPGEPPLRSSLLVARHGRGYYVYTGLAFFRQLPTANPGAWRLFANLVSLGKTE